MKTHWKKLINPDYLNEAEFYDENGELKKLIGTIKNVELTKITNPKGKTDELHVLYFNECKPLILSAKKNFQNIERALKTPFVEEWTGHKIELYYDPNVKFGSERVGGVRVSPMAPKIEKPVMNESHPNYDKFMAAIKSGTYTVEKALTQYDIESKLLTKLKKLDNA
jgi:hypothetical protein